MELRRYAEIVWRWLWLLLMGTAVAGATAFFVSRAQTPQYRATSILLINQAQTAAGTNYNDVLANQQLSKTYVKLVTSDPVLDAVSGRTGVPWKELKRMVSASLQRETQLINVNVRNADPELAATVANEIARVFSEQIRAAQLGAQASAEEDLQRQIAALQPSITEKQSLVDRLATPQPGMNEDQRRDTRARAQSELEALRQSQALLQRQLQDQRLAVARSINSVTLANPARVPETPVSPRVTLNAILGAMLGLVVAGAIIAVMEYLDDTVKSPDDVTRAVGAPTLGAITRLPGVKGRKRQGRKTVAGRLLTSAGSSSAAAEAYRIVRTNLEFARTGRPNHTMLVTSALPGEGKSTTTANLAIVLAQTGRQVIVVDADMRRPSQHRLFDMPNTAGLSTLFVMDEPAVAQLLRPTPLDNLRVLVSGPLPPNPAELIGSQRMQEIVELLTHEAEIVIFDSPPLLGVADAAVLAPRVDGVVLVLDSGRTRAGALSQAVKALERAQATLWGVLLNKLQARRGEGYYYYHYQYYGAADAGREAPIATNGVLPAAAPARNGRKGAGRQDDASGKPPSHTTGPR